MILKLHLITLVSAHQFSLWRALLLCWFSSSPFVLPLPPSSHLQTRDAQRTCNWPWRRCIFLKPEALSKGGELSLAHSALWPGPYRCCVTVPHPSPLQPVCLHPSTPCDASPATHSGHTGWLAAASAVLNFGRGRNCYGFLMSCRMDPYQRFKTFSYSLEFRKDKNKSAYKYVSLCLHSHSHDLQPGRVGGQDRNGTCLL